MSTVPKVAIVVPTWNSAGLVPRLLDSIEAQAAPYELLVVDNGSRDGTLDLLSSRSVEHVALPTNSGFAAAMNRGVAATAAPLVLGLNADTILGAGAIERLATALIADPMLGGVQPRILQLESERPGDPDAARLYSAGMALCADGRALETGAGEKQSSQWLREREIFGVCGAVCLLRREMLEQLGGYDERYFAFYEDVDLNVRARMAGWRFSYVPEAVAWHIGNASWMSGFDRPRADNARMVARNRLATQIKFMPTTAIPRIAVVEAGALLRALAQRRFWATLRGKVEALRWLPELLRDRRRLREEGDPAKARRWLGVRFAR